MNSQLLRLMMSIVFGSAAACSALAACPAQHRISNAALGAFLNEPSILIARNTTDQRGLSTQVTDIALADGTTLPLLLRVARAASSEQRLAIGYGLGRAAGYCLSRDSSVSRRIDEAVRSLGNREVLYAFRLAKPSLDEVEPRLRSLSPDGQSQRETFGLLDPIKPEAAGRLPAGAEPEATRGHLRVLPSSRLDARDFEIPDLKMR